MEAFAAYGQALASIAVFVILVMLMSPITALKKTGEGMPPGATPHNAYEDGTYRWNRAYLNATENFGVVVGAVMVAILAGVDPWWVNTLALVFLIARVLHAVVLIAGIGPQNYGPRTLAYVVSWACCIVLAVMALAAVL